MIQKKTSKGPASTENSSGSADRACDCGYSEGPIFYTSTWHAIV